METAVATLPTARLLGVIATQTAVARLGLDLTAVMDLVVERAQALTDACGAVIELHEGDEMVYRAASGIAANQLGLRLRADASLSGVCVRSATSAISADTELDERVDLGACRRVGIRSMLVVPLMHDTEAVGVLKVLGAAPDAFDNEDMALINLLSELVAASMYHAMTRGADDLLYRATHDALTGVGNRALFYDTLRRTIAAATGGSERFALLYFDLDGLKAANDRLGHGAGDELLRICAQRMLGASLKADTVARIGGDEFCVLLAHVADRHQAEAAAARYTECIRGHVEAAGEHLPLHASVGVAVFPDDGDDVETLIAAADKAMYRDKQGRRAAR